METKTSLASGIEVTKDKSDYDAACKRLFDVNVIAEQCIEGTPYVSEVPVAPDETAPIIQGIAQEQSSPTEGSFTFDIYFNAIVPSTDEVVQLIINVEAQSDCYPGYPLLKRGIFYCGRMLSSQAGTVFTKSHYEKLRKVYSIWLCTNPPKNRKNTINRYRMIEENMVGDMREQAEDYDLLSLVMIGLGDANEKNYDGVLKLLSVLLSSKTAPAEKKQILQDEFHIPMTQTMDREVSLMCNLSEGVWRDGEARGIEKGILASLQNLMASMNLTIDEAMNALRIPEADRQTYLSKLKQ